MSRTTRALVDGTHDLDTALAGQNTKCQWLAGPPVTPDDLGPPVTPGLLLFSFPTIRRFFFLSAIKTDNKHKLSGKHDIHRMHGLCSVKK